MKVRTHVRAGGYRHCDRYMFDDKAKLTLRFIHRLAA